MSCKDKCVRTFWQLKKYILFFYYLFLFIWLHWVLVKPLQDL